MIETGFGIAVDANDEHMIFVTSTHDDMTQKCIMSNGLVFHDLRNELLCFCDENLAFMNSQKDDNK